MENLRLDAARSRNMRSLIRIVLAAGLIVAGTSPVFSASTGPSSMPSSMPNLPDREMTPEDRAKVAFNAGVRAVNKADKYAANADKASDDRKKEKAAKE